MFKKLEEFSSFIVYDLIGLESTSKFAESLHFFFYDSTKILILLVLVIFAMGIINSYFPVDRVQNYLSRKKLFGLEYLMASIFGVVTPFCSCSSVPLFIGFVRGGIPLGVTFAFLVTSPLVNEVAIGLFIGLFGLKTTIIYVISGVLLGTISGFILEKLNLNTYLTPWIKEILLQARNEKDRLNMSQPTLIQRIPSIWKEMLQIVKSVVPYVLIGIAIGAIIHGYVPNGFFEKFMAKDNLFAVPMVTLAAIPMYSNAAGILPVVQVFVEKGIPLGTAIAFMMGVVALSLPEAMLLKKVMTIKLIAIFYSVVTVCIILSGYLFNILL